MQGPEFPTQPPGSLVLVNYNNPRDRLYHERLLLAWIVGNSWVVATPDFDVYVEDLSIGRDIRDLRPRPRHGVLPIGLAGGTDIYSFDPPLVRNRISELIEEGIAEAKVERRRRLGGFRRSARWTRRSPRSSKCLLLRCRRWEPEPRCHRWKT
jgi:hypothetical protein